MYKNLYLTAIFGLVMLISVHGQERYVDKIFDDVSVTADVQYGTNISILTGAPEPEDLFMDIYHPTGDTLTDRPVVIFAHAGDFLPAIVNQSPYGTRKDSATVEFCLEMARRGYVAASISYRVGWNPFGSALEIKETVLLASYRISQDMHNAVRFLRKTIAEDGNPYGISEHFAVGGFDAAGYAANNVAYLKTTDQTLKPKFLDLGTMPPTPFVIEEIHGNPQGTNEAAINIPNYAEYSSEIDAVIDFEGGLGDFDWIEAGDPPTITFQRQGKFENPGIRDVTIAVGGSIIIAEGAFPDTIVHRATELGNQDVFRVLDDPLSEKGRAATGGLEGIYIYTPQTMDGRVLCDNTAGVDSIGYGGNTYGWNWYNEEWYAAAYTAAFGDSKPASQAICEYNTGQGNPNDPVVSRMLIDTMSQYIAPRLVLAMGLNETTAVSNVSADEVGLKVFPNPAGAMINVSANELIRQVHIYDLQGRIVTHRKIENGQTLLNLQHLPDGMYILRAAFEKGVVSSKITVHH